MENKAHFGSLTPRMQAYRESVLDQKPYIDAQRAVLATEAYKKNLNQPPVMKRALMLQNILAGIDIYIEDETILVGNQSSVNRGAPVFPEYTMKFIMEELDLFEKRDGDVFYITEETKQQLREIAPFWENNNLRARGEALIPEEMQVYMDTGFFGMEGCRSIWTPDFSAWRVSSTPAMRTWQWITRHCCAQAFGAMRSAQGNLRPALI